MELEAWKQEFFSDKMPACPRRGHWVSFCLVDETGNGKNYGGCRTRSMTVPGNNTAVD